MDKSNDDDPHKPLAKTSPRVAALGLVSFQPKTAIPIIVSVLGIISLTLMVAQYPGRFIFEGLGFRVTIEGTGTEQAR